MFSVLVCIYYLLLLKGKGYTFNRLPQGFVDCAAVFSHHMSSNLSKLTPPCGSQLLLYVDDILLASKTESACHTDSNALLCLLAENGHKCSRSKLQFVLQEVKFLGHLLSKKGCLLSEFKLFLKFLKPTTHKALMSFLSSANYCRQWIPNYVGLSGPLYSMLTGEGTSSTVTWTSATET